MNKGGMGRARGVLPRLKNLDQQMYEAWGKRLMLFGSVFLGGDVHIDVASLLVSIFFEIAVLCDHGPDPLEHIDTPFGIGHFAPSEEDAQFDMFPLVKKFNGMLDLVGDIILSDLDREFHLFDFDLLLIFACLFFLLLELVFVFTIVHDLRDGRFGIGGHQYEIQSPPLGYTQRFIPTDDPELFTVIGNHAQFTITNTVVQDSFVRLFPTSVVVMVSTQMVPSFNC